MTRLYLVVPLLLSVKPRGALATYPTLSLTDDVALEDVLADIPLFSVGFVAFGVFTFFFAMRRINRITLYIHLAILSAFLASVFDLSQIIRRGSYNTSHNLQISSVQILIVLRELGFALSFGLRFFFFWAYVAEPPRGELPLVPIPDDRRLNFISLDSESILHSASWVKWSVVGFVLKWTLLLMTLAVPVLQGIWRLVNAFNKFGPIYYVEGGIEIVLSAIFILKLFANILMSPLVPRWKTLRDYMPPIIALLIGMGVGIGNILCFQFSETILGRFLQSVELYILVLFVLISAFYKMPVRSSVVAELVRRRLAQTNYSNMEDGGRRNSIIVGQNAMGVDGDLRDGSRRSGQSAGRPSLVQRFSSASFFPSRLMSRRNSTRTGSGERRQDNDGEEGDQRRLWNQGEAELGNSPTEQRTTRGSIEQTPTQTPVAEAKETPGWRDPLFTSVVREDPLRRLPPAVLPTTSAVRVIGDSTRQPPQIIRSPASPSDSVAQSEMAQLNDIIIVPPPRSTTDSPIYGLDGIIRNLQVGGIDGLRESNLTLDRSSGIESLLRQQQELDMSIAGLRNFSPTSDSELGPPRVQSESLQSEFSLSNFPDPPFLSRSSDSSKTTTPTSTRAALPDTSDQSLPVTETDRAKSVMSEYSLMVDDVPFQLVQPRMPSASSSNAVAQNQPVSLVFSDATDSILGLSIGEASRGPRFDSQGTQYDVTSFIRGFSVPRKERDSEDTRLADISEGKSTESDTESVAPATISALKRVQLVDGRRPPDADAGNLDTRNAGSSAEPSSSTPGPVTLPTPPTTAPPAPAPAPVSQPQTQTQRPILSPNSSLPLAKGRGLPTGPRGRLVISKPIPQAGGVLNERTTFERPRPAPLILKDLKDNLSIPTDAVQGDRF